MNRIVEAVCRHVARQDAIAGIEPDYSNLNITVYLRNGTRYRYPGMARCAAQFFARLEQACAMFPDIHWHFPEDAMPDWLVAANFNRNSPPPKVVHLE
jgi:hypothetical protein